jgi:hypothetical protein
VLAKTLKGILKNRGSDLYGWMASDEVTVFHTSLLDQNFAAIHWIEEELASIL